MNSRAIDPELAAECSRLRQKYKTWMTTTDLAVEESVSVDTIQRRMACGHYGAIDCMPGGSKRALTANYVKHLIARIITA